MYNSKYQNIREVELTPSNKWGGQGLLGVSIRYASFEGSSCAAFVSKVFHHSLLSLGATENVWHILDVAPNSPAEVAGLISHTDYIIGADSLVQDVSFQLFF